MGDDSIRDRLYRKWGITSMGNEINFQGLTEEEFEKKVFEQRYDMLKKRQIREAIEAYRQDAKEDAKYLVLASNIRKDVKAKTLYSAAGAFQSWKEAEQFSKKLSHSIVVDSEKKCEVTEQ